jgi:hypothetical protein
MLTPREKREYKALADKVKAQRVKIDGREISVGKESVTLPQLPPASTTTRNIF